MSHEPDGGQAFPSIVERGEYANTPEGYRTVRFAVGGMSLRDWFAGQALGAVIQCVDGALSLPKCAALAYDYADAMLEEREK